MVCGRRSTIGKQNILSKETLFAYGLLFLCSFALLFSLNASGVWAFPLLQAPLNISPVSPAIATANENFLVLFADFPDSKASPEHNFFYFEQMLASRQPDYLSMYNYYSSASGGKFSPQFHLVQKWYTAKNSMSYYGEDASVSSNCGNEIVDSANACTISLVQEIISQASADGVKFSGYAKQEKLHLILIHAGANQARHSILQSQGQSLLHTKWQYLETLLIQDKTEIHSYVLASEDDGIAAIAHEIGHELGLPELYDSDQSSDGVGLWDLMGLQQDLDAPIGLGAWPRSYLGWANPFVIEKTGDYDIGAGEVYKVPITGREYFLVENRQKNIFDNAPGSGLLIWHIDESAPVNPANPLLANDNDRKRLVDLEEAHDRTQHLDVSDDPDLANQRNYGEQEDAWYFAEDSEKCKGITWMKLFARCHGSTFNSVSKPNTQSNAGKKIGVSIIVTSKPGALMRATIIVPDSPVTAISSSEATASTIKEKNSEVGVPVPTGNTILLQPRLLLSSEGLKSPMYMAAGIIFMVDLIIFYAVINRKGGEKR